MNTSYWYWQRPAIGAWKIRTGISVSAALVALLCLILSLAASPAAAGSACPAVTVDKPLGLAGTSPQQFELAEFEELTGCELSFSDNPAIGELNARIQGNPDKLPPVAERLPEEPLVVAPYQEIGQYGGTLRGLSHATEAGTSDILSCRHVNLMRYADDLKTIVPNVAKSWSWNEDFTVLTVQLRKGHKWSDGQPFTAEDIVFWYEDLILNTDIYPKTPARWLFEGQPMEMTAVDPTTVKMIFPVPAPNIINRFAVDYGQPFQPKHFLKQFHIKYNSQADELARAKGKENWAELLNEYYGGSDWKDVPSPLIDGFDTQVVPTLESHILVEETSRGRLCVANPFFHMVDTKGQQLPYINAIDERYVPNKEVRNLKISNGEVDYKQQSVFIEDYPLYKQNEQNGNFKVDLAPGLGQNVFYSFNTTHKDPFMRELFNDVRFLKAMSLALDREEINEIAYLGQGEPEQALPCDPRTVDFVSEADMRTAIDYDPETARELLDELGLVDTSGDGLRDRPNGESLVIRLQFSNQGGPVRQHELASDYWRDIGVRVDLKEVSSDEYRANASNNLLDVTTWYNDEASAPAISQTTWKFVPPFGSYFNPGTGWEWADWMKSEGQEGQEPPQEVKKLYTLADQFVQTPLGSAESNRIGREIVDIHLSHLWKIGTVGGIRSPIVHHNRVANFQKMTAKTYDYYWAYPYRPQQWFLK